MSSIHPTPFHACTEESTVWARCEQAASWKPRQVLTGTHPISDFQNYENYVKGNAYCLSDLASDILLQQPKLRQVCNSRKLEYIQSEPCLPPDLLVTMGVVYTANTPPGRKSKVHYPCDVSYLCSLHKRPLWCVHFRERVGLCMCASS